MSHLGLTVMEVNPPPLPYPSAHEINDLSACLLTQTKRLPFTFARTLSLFPPCVMSITLSLCHSEPLSALWWPRLERRNEKGRRVGERRGGGGSKQIPVLSGRPPAKVCPGLGGMERGGATGREVGGGRWGMT